MSNKNRIQNQYLKPRIIARLDIKGPNVVKGIRFEGLRVMGNPQTLAAEYYEQGADELLYIDTVASLYGRNNITDVVKRAASKIFIPMIVGGGIRSVEDAQNLLRNGADKVAVNTAAVKRPELLTEISESLGSQALVASLQIKSREHGKWEIFTDNGRETTGIDAIEWALHVEALGAGEILVTSVDQDGTGKGFETECIDQIVQKVNIPVIAGGGADSCDHVTELILKTHVDAVVIGSILHYNKVSISEIKRNLKFVSITTASH